MSENDSSCALPELPQPPTYRHVADAPGYCVGSDGSVWSCWQRSGREPSRISTEWKMMRPGLALTPTGGPSHTLVSLYIGGKKVTRSVHCVVAEAFLGQCPEGLECCHENGNALDNRVKNLRWDTTAANAADRKRHGNETCGERSGKAKLTEAQVRAMRSEYAAGVPIKIIAEKYGMDRNHTGDVIKGRSWKHVT